MDLSEIYIIAYHYVRDLKFGRYNKIKGLDVNHFKEQIIFLKKNFNVIKIEDIFEALNSNNEIHFSSNKPFVLLTFDDGYIDHYTTVFPILDEFKLQGSFYIPAMTFSENKLLDVNKIHFVLASTDITNLYEEVIKQIVYYRNEGGGENIPTVDDLIKKYEHPSRLDDSKTIFVKRMLQTALPEKLRGIIASNLFKKYIDIPEDVFARELYLNKDQIRCMKNNGMHIGIHGYNHYWLGDLSKEQQEQDIKHALSLMEEFIDKDNWVMNYPYGSYNNDTIRLIENLGCKFALTTTMNKCSLKKHNRYELPRVDTIDFPPRSENYLNYKG